MTVISDDSLVDEAGGAPTMPDLIAAWREDLRSDSGDAPAAERSRLAQSAFGIDL